MWLELALGALGVLGLTDLGLTLRRQRPVVVQKADFDCPYCHDRITGVRELDLINHTACIDKAKSGLETALKIEEAKAEQQRIEADKWTRAREIEAEHQRQREATKAAEKARIRAEELAAAKEREHLYSVKVQEISTYNHDPNRYKWSVTKGGETIASGKVKSGSDGHAQAAAAIEAHKAGKPPSGDGSASYTVK